MASINGIELKGIKEFKGHEGESLCQGNIYYNGKKVGFWSQDSWGGCDNINIDYNLSNELRTEINNILDNYECDSIFKGISDLYDEYYDLKTKNDFINSNKHLFKGGEFLFGELLQLIDMEKTYKKYSKLWGINTIAICYKDFFNSVIRGSKLDKEHFKEQLNNDKSIKLSYVFERLNDFNMEV